VWEKWPRPRFKVLKIILVPKNYRVSQSDEPACRMESKPRVYVARCYTGPPRTLFRHTAVQLPAGKTYGFRRWRIFQWFFSYIEVLQVAGTGPFG
jgi:hypothetical protein